MSKKPLGCAGWGILLVVVGLAGVLLVVFGSMLWERFGRYHPPFKPRPLLPRAARPEPVPIDAPGLDAEVRPLLEALGKALIEGDSKGRATLYDAERLHDDLDLPAEAGPDRAAFAAAFIRGMADAPIQPALVWKALEIRRVRRLPGGEAVVDTIHPEGGMRPKRFRWWLVRRMAGWRIYDEEDLNTGIRLSLFARSGIDTGSGYEDTLQKDARSLLEAFRAESLGKRLEAEMAVVRLSHPLPEARYEAMRRFAHAGLTLVSDRFDETLAHLAAAEKANPDLPQAPFIRGVALNGLGRWKEALVELRKYKEAMGDDAAVAVQIGIAEQGLGKGGK